MRLNCNRKQSNDTRRIKGSFLSVYSTDLPKDCDVPPVPLKTYQWEDIRRQKLEGRYPWTHLYKPPFDDENWDKLKWAQISYVAYCSKFRTRMLKIQEKMQKIVGIYFEIPRYSWYLSETLVAFDSHPNEFSFMNSSHSRNFNSVCATDENRIVSK